VVERPRDPIVADGRDRLRRQAWYQERKREVREAVGRRYEARLAATSGLAWVVLYLRMRREIRRELDALAPRRGSYLRTS
jgi:hypothetical protein